jgi:hypothetical protein
MCFFFSVGDAFIIVCVLQLFDNFFEASNCQFWKNMAYPESNLNFHHIIHHPLDEPRCYMWAMCIWNEPPSLLCTWVTISYYNFHGFSLFGNMHSHLHMAFFKRSCALPFKMDKVRSHNITPCACLH